MSGGLAGPWWGLRACPTPDGEESSEPIMQDGVWKDWSVAPGPGQGWEPCVPVCPHRPEQGVIGMAQLVRRGVLGSRWWRGGGLWHP